MKQRELQSEKHRHPLAKWMVTAIVFVLCLSSPLRAQEGTWHLVGPWPDDYAYLGKNLALSWPYLVVLNEHGVAGVYRLDDDEWIIDSRIHFASYNPSMLTLDGSKIAISRDEDSLIEIGVHAYPYWEREFTIDVGRRYEVVDISLSGDVLAAAIHDPDADLRSVLIFRFDGIRWDREQQIFVSATNVAVDDDHLLMNDLETGNAVIFTRGASEWDLVQRFWENTESPVTDLALDGDAAVVGRATFQYSTGIVKVYRRDEKNVWAEDVIVFQTDRVRGSLFGWSVDLDGNSLVVGAMQDGDDSRRPGAAWFFDYNAAFDRWAEKGRLTSADYGETEPDFGRVVGVSGGFVAVGAPWEDVGSERRAGATWVFELERYWLLRLSTPYPGFAGEHNSIGVEHATPGEPIYFIYGFEAGSTEIPRCPGVFVEIQGPQLIDVAYANADGYATIDMLVPESAQGLTVLLQAVDWAACQTSNLVEHTFE